MAISAGASLPSSPESGSVMTANCQHCGQHFQTRPYALRKGQGKFCSRICSDRAAPRSTFVCQQCAQSFSILTCKVRSKQRRLFCSRVCQQLARSARVTCICTECQQSFSLVKSQVEKGRGIFCSRTCQRRAHLRQPVSMEQRRATSKGRVTESEGICPTAPRSCAAVRARHKAQCRSNAHFTLASGACYTMRA